MMTPAKNKNPARIKREISGILLLDKPKGCSSNHILQKTKHLFSAKKAGHTGSLDPLATGLLPICFGEATKFSQFLLDADKSYQVKMQLGVRTTTSDAEGEVVATKSVPHFSQDQIEAFLNQFRGLTMQVPSMYSALKHQGKPLYWYAREGINIDRPARPIEISQLICLEQGSDYLILEVHCSKGTYIRTLVDDLGELIGCGAHVTELRRLSAGHFSLVNSFTLTGLEKMTQEKRDATLISVEQLLIHLPVIHLSSLLTPLIRMGQAVFISGAPTAGLVQLFSHDKIFLGVGIILPDGRVAPKRLCQRKFLPPFL